jgi:cell division protein FtsA
MAVEKENPRPLKKNGRVIKLADKNTPAPMQGISPEDIIFAMDIGTRTVAGVVGVQDEKCFRVLATEVCEHMSRAMMDGQIHDIDQTAATVSEVKKRLESKIGIKLKRVAIAAAGRVLKTCQVRVDKSLEPGTEIDADLISGMEIEGIQRAQMILDENSEAEDKTQYYCVGYSVINYYLNGYVISKLTGHRGKTASADILATFLPLTVVDSLYAVVNRIGLEVSSLTLEPIAAINAAIPADLRLLNLALVDIGAGTSDIALTKDGSVFAYAMVPTAGDEITERIAQRYLVDFNTGEKIKTSLSSSKENIVFTDILKKKHTVTAADVLNDIEDSIQALSSTICQKILEYNHKAPNAVFLVGGGSRIPMLPRMISGQLGLPEDRVVVRGRDVIRDIRFCDKKLCGPESITPYGIAVTAQMYAGKDFVSVTVNEKKVKLFNSKKLTVADALILYGFDAADLIGRSGKGITFTVNGEVRRARGEYGVAAEIYLNGKQAGLDTPLTFGDSIMVTPARDGKDAEVKAYELVSDFRSGIVELNGNPVDVSTVIMVNGTRVNRDTAIKDGDAVAISSIRTLRDLLDAAGYTFGDCDITINGSETNDPDYILHDRDIIACCEHGNGNIGGSIDKEEAGFEMPSNPAEDTEDEDAADEPAEAAEADNIQKDEGSFDVIVNGKVVSIKDKKTQNMFIDVFNYIDFDLSKPQGTIMLKLNGRSAAFTDEIRHGDTIEIYWGK